MRVLDLGAVRGYSTELLARAVAPDGRVLCGSMQVARGKTSGVETQMQDPAGFLVA